MEIVVINSIEDIKHFGNLSVAHGFFDGVHKAHQSLILEAVSYAKENNLKSAVVTFDKKYVEGKTKLEYLQHLRLSTLSRKTEILMHLGVEIMFILNFEAFKDLDANSYIKNIIERIGTKYFVMGKDNRFGASGFGNSDNIISMIDSSVKVAVIDLLCENCDKISTSIIKRMFSTHVIEDINAQLGYFYKLNGKVVRGHQVGRTIGFPTANMNVTDEMLIPKKGVYATIVKYNGVIYYAMTNVGYNPTVDFRKSLIVETHIFNFELEIYEEDIDLYFIKKIREEEKFENIDCLVEQIKKDQITTMQIHECVDLDKII